MPDSFSPDLKDLISRMIEVNPKKRITAEEIIKHKWMTNNLEKCDHDGAGHHAHSEVIVDNLKKYKGQSILKQTILSMVVKQLAPQEIEKFKHMFETYDDDNSGFLTKKEIKDALKEADVTISLEELDKIVDQLDLDGNDEINYTEFLSAAMDLSQFLT
jgi:calcium-dependent protein kinase